MGREDVEPNWIICIGWVKEDDVRVAMLRNVGQNLIDEIAMGVEDCNALSVGDVLGDQTEQKSRLAGTRSADDIRMSTALVGIQGNESALAGMVVCSEDG